MSEADMRIFEARLVEFYKTTMDEGYARLRRHIEKSFPPSRFVNYDELIDATITRLIGKTGEFDQKGTRIANFEAMATRIAQYIKHEDYNRKRVRKDTPIDWDSAGDPGALKSSEPRATVDNEIQAIEKEMMSECFMNCANTLPPDERDLLLEYYRDLPPKELAELRLKLAIKEAGGVRGATPDEIHRQLNNLQSKVKKLRDKRVDDCVINCVKNKKANHMRLQYMYQQQASEKSSKR
jgi:RNA polymerase sigma factor (sigma-70 family)